MENLLAISYIFHDPMYIDLQGIDFSKNVLYLKGQIAARLDYEAENIELVYDGLTLDNEQQLNGLIEPGTAVHCFRVTKQWEPYVTPPETTTPANLEHVEELFAVTSHIQISVSSRVSILQKVLAKYPEFRRNLAAQALIRDSVLSNSLQNADVIKNVAKHYPLICDAAPFIVATIKKELTRNVSGASVSEPTTDSTNSSEEENSLGGNANADNATGRAGGTSRGARGGNSRRIRMVSQQQLQNALREAGLPSVNSLQSISQRNADNAAAQPNVPLANSASGERLQSEQYLRNELQRALRQLVPSFSAGGEDANAAPVTPPVQRMDINDETPPSNSATAVGDIPDLYRQHQYAEQLRTMAQMGFTNYEENLTYLNITNGEIEQAINLIVFQ